MGKFDNFDVEGFLKASISCALEVVGEARAKGMEVSLDRFYESVSDRVCGERGLSRKEFMNVHHPIHWALFCDWRAGNGCRSPLSFKQSTVYDKPGASVELSREITAEDLPKLLSRTAEYTEYVKGRLASLQSDSLAAS